MSYLNIKTILDTQLKTVTSLPMLQLENILVKPANTPAWARSTLLPAATTVQSIGPNGRERKSGLMQVDLFYINNTGTSAALAMADTVIASFTKGLYLTDGSFTVMVTRSYMDSAKPFPNYYQVPVIVEWECFV